MNDAGLRIRQQGIGEGAHGGALVADVVYVAEFGEDHLVCDPVIPGEPPVRVQVLEQGGWDINREASSRSPIAARRSGPTERTPSMPTSRSSAGHQRADCRVIGHTGEVQPDGSAQRLGESVERGRDEAGGGFACGIADAGDDGNITDTHHGPPEETELWMGAINPAGRRPKKKLFSVTDAPQITAALQETRTPTLPRPAGCRLEEFAPKPQTITEMISVSTDWADGHDGADDGAQLRDAG